MSYEKKHLYQDQDYLWAHIKKLDQHESRDFIQEALRQNLAHARHVENERLNYSGTVATVCALGLAFLTNTSAPGSLSKFFICGFLFIFVLFSFLLNNRWSNAFDRHLEYAKGCYYILHSHFFDDQAEPNLAQKEDLCFKDSSLTGYGLGHLPLYSFNIANPYLFELFKFKDPTRTKNYFIIYYWTLLLLIFALITLLIIGAAKGDPLI